MKIAVLYGGYSRERDVSASTGTGAARALRRRGHEVALVDAFLGLESVPDDVGPLFTSEDRDELFSVRETEPDLNALRARRPGRRMVGPGVLELCEAADFVFLALHGGDGENGRLQAWLDMYGVPYTGADYLGSALAMNKEITKNLFRQAGIPTPREIYLGRGEALPETLPLPCVVKPCSGGSSVATAIVRTREELAPALDAAFACEDKVLIEEYIRGRELTAGILDGAAMPVIEIIPREGFYDYKNKYQAGMTVELCPAPLDAATTARVQRLAERSYAALHLEAYARADFLMDDAGELYCLELNTLPGMTPTSLIPQMAYAMGMDYGQLCERLIEVSRKKYEK